MCIIVCFVNTRVCVTLCVYKDFRKENLSCIYIIYIYIFLIIYISTYLYKYI